MFWEEEPLWFLTRERSPDALYHKPSLDAYNTGYLKVKTLISKERISLKKKVKVPGVQLLLFFILSISNSIYLYLVPTMYRDFHIAFFSSSISYNVSKKCLQSYIIKG